MPPSVCRRQPLVSPVACSGRGSSRHGQRHEETGDLIWCAIRGIAVEPIVCSRPTREQRLTRRHPTRPHLTPHCAEPWWHVINAAAGATLLNWVAHKYDGTQAFMTGQIGAYAKLPTWAYDALNQEELGALRCAARHGTAWWHAVWRARATAPGKTHACRLSASLTSPRHCLAPSTFLELVSQTRSCARSAWPPTAPRSWRSRRRRRRSSRSSSRRELHVERQFVTIFSSPCGSVFRAQA